MLTWGASLTGRIVDQITTHRDGGPSRNRYWAATTFGSQLCQEAPSASRIILRPVGMATRHRDGGPGELIGPPSAFGAGGPMKAEHPPGPPMTLGNMRQQGVLGSCDGHRPRAPARSHSHRILHHRSSLVALRIFDTRLVPTDLLDKPQARTRPADDARQRPGPALWRKNGGQRRWHCTRN